MKKMSLTAALILCFALPLDASSWPAYENTTRHWGNVTELYSTVVAGLPWVGFVLQVPDGTYVRYDCGVSAIALGCDLIVKGDSILVTGHEDDLLSCQWDGVSNMNIPNVIWRCGSEGCTQITP